MINRLIILIVILILFQRYYKEDFENNTLNYMINNIMDDSEPNIRFDENIIDTFNDFRNMIDCILNFNDSYSKCTDKRILQLFGENEKEKCIEKLYFDYISKFLNLYILRRFKLADFITINYHIPKYDNEIIKSLIPKINYFINNIEVDNNFFSQKLFLDTLDVSDPDNLDDKKEILEKIKIEFDAIEDDVSNSDIMNKFVDFNNLYLKKIMEKLEIYYVDSEEEEEEEHDFLITYSLIDITKINNFNNSDLLSKLDDIISNELLEISRIDYTSARLFE